MRVKTKSKILLLSLFCGALFYAVGFASTLVNGSSDAIQLAYSPYGDKEYTSSGQLEVSTKGAEKFHINTPANLGGSINLRVWDEERCLAKFECWARANTGEKAKDFVDQVDLNLDREGELVQLTLSAPRPAPWEGTNFGIKVNLDIFIPENFFLKTTTVGFDLDIRGPLTRVDIESKYGTVFVSGISDNTKVGGPYNKVNLEDIQGDLEVNTTYNSIYARNVDTKRGKAFFKTIYGKIDLENIRGEMEAETIYSSIYATGVSLLGGVNSIHTVYSKIDLELKEIEDSELYVRNTYGNINVSVPEDISARLTLTVDRGSKIQTTGLLITPTVLNRTRLEGICGQGESKIEMDINGIGKILLEGR